LQQKKVVAKDEEKGRKERTGGYPKGRANKGFFFFGPFVTDFFFFFSLLILLVPFTLLPYLYCEWHAT